MRIRRLAERFPRRVAFWALAGVALLVSHDAIFLVQVGPGESLVRALRGAGHGYWLTASVALATIGLAAAAAAWLRLRGLRRRAAELGATPVPGAKGRLLWTWLRLFVVVATGFGVQENLEHYLGHMHATGLGALLGPEYPLALPVIAFISGVAALLASATVRAEDQLLAAIAAVAEWTFGHPPRSLPRPPARRTVTLISPLASALAGRAPPGAFVSLS